MTTTQTKRTIQQALHTFTNGNFREDALTLFDTLGYRSDKQLELESNSAAGFLDTFNLHGRLNPERALLDEWQAVEFLFQLTQDEISQSPQLARFTTGQVDNSIIESYLFLALDLQGDHYNRTQLARLTREVNKQFPMPVLLLFRYGPSLTLSVINRRLHKRDPGQDVLEKVTLIKDINYSRPHRAHVEILLDLSLERLYRSYEFTNFVELHRAWQTTLDSSELNKRFFKEIANWYFWAVENVTFPPDAHSDPQVRTATSVIRLITRLIFVWFIKEKGLLPDDLFDGRKLDQLLRDDDPNHSTYYKAILQNLFFATLNQEMNTPAKPDNRKFRHRAKQKGQRDQHYLIHNVYRYERYFTDSAQALELFSTIPFLNGGLFECLDHKEPEADKVLRIDGFSDRPDNPLTVPDFLFFGEEREVDLNEIYGTKGRRYKVRGLIDILSSYKFTITENTPIEEEIALDPELLGKVFENLLAAYNPETETTARKQTGSFYTPREIVNYMVDESLVAYLESQLSPPSIPPKGGEDDSPLPQGEGQGVRAKLRHLLAYNDEDPLFTDEAEVTRLIAAIDGLKILDPAAGSGAFPMGILHKLVFILGKLDPHNERWKEKQIEKAVQIPDSTIRNRVIEEIEEAFERNELDYGRKLYLIENCIYGVDIQPVAVQIAKLRFFISLVVDQTIEDRQPNRGVLPLPNLETKFVAANTLLGIDKPAQMAFKDPAIEQKEKELEEVRHRYFTARTPTTKEKYRQRDAEIREEIGRLLRGSGFRPETTEKLAGWNPYDQNASADFFDPEWMFGIADGFDIVIGNPPYVSHDRISNKTQIKRFDAYEPFADLYCYFIETSIKLQSYGGILCFITSNSFLRAAYGGPIRRFIRKNNALLRVINIEDTQLFESAIVNVVILLSQTHSNRVVNCKVVNSVIPADVNFENFVNENSFEYPQGAFDDLSWTLVEPRLLSIQHKIQTSGKTLEELGAKIRLGLATGNNKAFIIDEQQRNEFLNKNPKNGEIIKPILRGRDIFRYYYVLPELYILLTKNGVNVERDYPDIYNYLDSFGQKFKSRGAQGQHWTNLRACAFFDDFKEEMIIWIELTDEGRFALCEEEIYLLILQRNVADKIKTQDKNEV